LNFLNYNKIKTCLDLGCGHGEYTKFLNDNKIITKGYDGNPHTKLITNGLCDILDLSEKINLEKCECVISLEVGEHIPKEYEDIFIKNLINHSSKIIIISWANPGQGGYGHVNCQANEYIRKKIELYGWKSILSEENILREKSSMSWFKNTIMVFEREFYDKS
jgi:hypothetical protein